MARARSLTAFALAALALCSAAHGVSADCAAGGDCDDRSSLLQFKTSRAGDLKAAESPAAPEGAAAEGAHAADRGWPWWVQEAKSLVGKVFPWAVMKLVNMLKDGLLPQIKGMMNGIDYTLMRWSVIEHRVGGTDFKWLEAEEGEMQKGFTVKWSGVHLKLGAHFKLEIEKRRKTITDEGDLSITIGGDSIVEATVIVGLGEAYLPFVKVSTSHAHLEVLDVDGPQQGPILSSGVGSFWHSIQHELGDMLSGHCEKAVVSAFEHDMGNALKAAKAADKHEADSGKADAGGEAGAEADDEEARKRAEARTGFWTEEIKKMLSKVFDWAVAKLVHIFGGESLPPITGISYETNYTLSKYRYVHCAVGKMESHWADEKVKTGSETGVTLSWSDLFLEFGAHYKLERSKHRKTLEEEGEVVVGVGKDSKVGATVLVGLGKWYVPYIKVSKIDVKVEVASVNAPMLGPVLEDQPEFWQMMEPDFSGVATEAVKEALTEAFKVDTNKALQARSKALEAEAAP